MNPELIVMLTWHDRTVANSREIFRRCADAPARCWGFKNVGLPENEMRELALEMKAAGKKTFLEVISFEPEDSEKYAELCGKCGFDVLLGTKFSAEALEIARKYGMDYFPFVGKPINSTIEGSIEEIVSEAQTLEKAGVNGLNLSIFRYVGDGRRLLTELKKKVSLPLCVPGNVNDAERIEYLKGQQVDMFTIGGAFFENKFADGFYNGIEAVDKILRQVNS